MYVRSRGVICGHTRARMAQQRLDSLRCVVLLRHVEQTAALIEKRGPAGWLDVIREVPDVHPGETRNDGRLCVRMVRAGVPLETALDEMDAADGANLLGQTFLLLHALQSGYSLVHERPLLRCFSVVDMERKSPPTLTAVFPSVQLSKGDTCLAMQVKGVARVFISDLACSHVDCPLDPAPRRTLADVAPPAPPVATTATGQRALDKAERTELFNLRMVTYLVRGLCAFLYSARSSPGTNLPPSSSEWRRIVNQWAAELDDALKPYLDAAANAARMIGAPGRPVDVIGGAKGKCVLPCQGTFVGLEVEFLWRPLLELHLRSRTPHAAGRVLGADWDAYTSAKEDRNFRLDVFLRLGWVYMALLTNSVRLATPSTRLATSGDANVLVVPSQPMA